MGMFQYLDPLPSKTALGCFADNYGSRALPTMYAYMRSQIDWYKPNKTVHECGMIARDQGYKYYGVQFYGECYSAPDSDAETDYNKYGDASNCWEGLGGDLSNFVYRFD